MIVGSSVREADYFDWEELLLHFSKGLCARTLTLLAIMFILGKCQMNLPIKSPEYLLQY